MLKDKKYALGLFLVLAAFITTVISFYLFVYTWFVFVIGAVLVIVSKQKTWKKIVSVAAPLILFVPAVLLFLMLYNYAPPKTYLVPEQYKGTLRIVYEEQCGQGFGEENGSKTVAFPADGILVLNEKFNGGTNSDDQYFYLGSNGKRNKIPYARMKSAGVLSLGTNPKGKSMDIQYVDYDLNFGLDEDPRSRKNLDSLTIVKVNGCRQTGR